VTVWRQSYDIAGIIEEGEDINSPGDTVIPGIIYHSPGMMYCMIVNLFVEKTRFVLARRLIMRPIEHDTRDST
jgi:hypothetical protein